VLILIKIIQTGIMGYLGYWFYILAERRVPVDSITNIIAYCFIALAITYFLEIFTKGDKK